MLGRDVGEYTYKSLLSSPVAKGAMVSLLAAHKWGCYSSRWLLRDAALSQNWQWVEMFCHGILLCRAIAKVLGHQQGRQHASVVISG